MTTNVDIRQNGDDFYFVDPVEMLWTRQRSDFDYMLSDAEIQAVRARFFEASDTLTVIDQAFAGLSDIMCTNEESGISTKAAINLSALIGFLGDQVAFANKHMADAHCALVEHFERDAKLATRVSGKAA